MSTPPAGRLVLLAALLATAASAQPADPVEALAATLALDADQADLVAEVFDPRDPASVWTLAAELVPTLDADQQAALFARPERAERPQGAGRASRRGDRGGARRGPDPTRVAVARAARDAALGLDEATSTRLDAALVGLDRRELMESVRDGALPEAVSAMLTPEQADLYRAQMALLMHLRRPGRSQ